MTEKGLLAINPMLMTVRHAYRHHQNLINVSGDNFNIFTLLKLSRKEVRLHSAFIGELLNVNGSHGMGDIFLRTFLEQMSRKNIAFQRQVDHFIANHSVVHLEYNMGGVSEDGTTGGRIDIRIDDNTHCIIIENKIDARDGQNQLARYSAIKNKIALIYLTLHGTDPDPASAKGLIKNEDFFCISYKNDITKWLETTIIQGKPSLALEATVRQYVSLITFLTTDNKILDMDKAILDILLKSDANIEAAFYVANYWAQAQQDRGNTIYHGVAAALQNSAIDFEIYPGLATFPRIELYPRNWKNHLIGFTEDKGLFYGIKRRNHREQPITFDKLNDYVKSSYKTSNWWLCYSHIHGDTFDPAGFKPYLDENYNQVVNAIVEKAFELYDIFEGCRDQGFPW